jgi:glycerol-3-phosphate acyltransferase PlsY
VAVTVAVAALLSGGFATAGLAGVAALVLLRHAGNIQRLLRRQEK